MRTLLHRILFLLLFFSVLSACRKDDSIIVEEPPVEPPEVIIIPETRPAILKGVVHKINDNIGGYYRALPARYDSTQYNYPLIVFFHGGGQFGNGSVDLPMLLTDGVPSLLEQKTFPPNFTVNGKNYAFIVLAPQFKRHPIPSEVKSFIDYAVSKYRIDQRRIYLTGFSNGGIITANAGAAYPATFAAIVPMAGVFVDDLQNKCKSIATGKLPLWIFHNEDDTFFYPSMPKNFITILNSFNPVYPPKFTLFSTEGYGHNAWYKASNPQYKENNMNIYEWMLQYSR